MLFTESQIVDDYVQMRAGHARQNSDHTPKRQERVIKKVTINNNL
jgi:hypothetical protein